MANRKNVEHELHLDFVFSEKIDVITIKVNRIIGIEQSLPRGSYTIGGELEAVFSGIIGLDTYTLERKAGSHSFTASCTTSNTKALCGRIAVALGEYFRIPERNVYLDSIRVQRPLQPKVGAR